LQLAQVAGPKKMELQRGDGPEQLQQQQPLAVPVVPGR